MDSQTTKVIEVSSVFLWVRTPLRIQPLLNIKLTEHTYLPKIEDPRKDWVSTVTAEAFLAFQNTIKTPIDNFATVGTGSGLDALAAIEILHPKKVMITDIHQDVAETAYQNVLANIGDDITVEVYNKVWNLEEPLVVSGIKYDLVYENLPNIPLPEEKALEEKMNSSSFVNQDLQTGKIAAHYLLELHSELLQQSHIFLAENGRVLSSIGARIPLIAILNMAAEVNCNAEILIYTRKTQTEALDVISGYAYHETLDKGPFYFYPTEKIEKVFSHYESPSIAAAHAFEIEKLLEPDRITATEALALLQKGGASFAHTVVVISSSPKKS